MLLLLVYIVASIVIAGVVLWGLQAMPAIDPTLKQIAKIVIVVVLVIWIVFVLVAMIQHVPLPALK